MGNEYEDYWRSKTDEELKQALDHLDSFGEVGVQVVNAEAVRRGLISAPPPQTSTATITSVAQKQDESMQAPTIQLIKIIDINIPIASMVVLAYKWILALFIAVLPFALIWFAIVSLN